MSEPTIYKPSIYNGNGVYNGDSVYNGNGVYNDGSESKIIYEFDVNRFNLDTLKDGNAQWKFNGRNVSLSKIDSYLSIVFSSGSKQYFTLSSIIGNIDLSQLDEFYLEFIYTGNFTYQTFFGPWTFSFCASTTNYYNFMWRKYNGSWSSVGSGNSFSASDVYKYHFVKNGEKFNIELFKNDTKILNSACDNFGYIDFLTHNVDYNGNSNPARINIRKLKIYLP